MTEGRDQEVTSEEVSIFGLSRLHNFNSNKSSCPADLIPSISAYLSGIYIKNLENGLVLLRKIIVYQVGHSAIIKLSVYGCSAYITVHNFMSFCNIYCIKVAAKDG